jgi:uncharacterized membrane protein
MDQKTMDSKSTKATLAVLTAAIAIYLLTCSHHSIVTMALVTSSFAMTALNWISAVNLMGLRPATKFAIFSIAFGLFAEITGTHYGWFFGEYTFTDVLGPRLWDVPIVIPMMWFTLTLIGYVMANLIFWQTPVHRPASFGQAVLASFMAALLVTAFDLGADPYLVYELEAWVMHKKDGAWFGETVQGFFGWMIVSFTIVMVFQVWNKENPPQLLSMQAKIFSGLPLLNYGSFMIYQIILGVPVETRTIAFFAMGIPLLIAIVQWSRWKAQLIK